MSETSRNELNAAFRQKAARLETPISDAASAAGVLIDLVDHYFRSKDGPRGNTVLVHEQSERLAWAIYDLQVRVQGIEKAFLDALNDGGQA